MSRHRWYRAKWPFSLEVLAKRLKLAPFSSKSDEGFIVDRWRKDTIEARYVERVVLEEEVVDPFGLKSISNRTAFYQTGFIVSGDASLVELVNPGRGVQRFVSRLLELTDFSLVIEPRRVAVRAWGSQVSTLLEAPNFVSLLQVSDVAVAPGIRGRFAFSGAQDVRGTATAFLKQQSGTEEKLQISVGGPHPGSILLSANGSAAVSGANPDLVEVVRKSIRSVA